MALPETPKALKMPKKTVWMLDVAELGNWSLFICFQCFAVA